MARIIVAFCVFLAGATVTQAVGDKSGRIDDVLNKFREYLGRSEQPAKSYDELISSISSIAGYVWDDVRVILNGELNTAGITKVKELVGLFNLIYLIIAPGRNTAHVSVLPETSSVFMNVYTLIDNSLADLASDSTSINKKIVEIEGLIDIADLIIHMKATEIEANGAFSKILLNETYEITPGFLHLVARLLNRSALIDQARKFLSLADRTVQMVREGNGDADFRRRRMGLVNTVQKFKVAVGPFLNGDKPIPANLEQLLGLQRSAAESFQHQASSAIDTLTMAQYHIDDHNTIGPAGSYIKHADRIIHRMVEGDNGAVGSLTVITAELQKLISILDNHHNIPTTDELKSLSNSIQEIIRKVAAVAFEQAHQINAPRQ